MRHVFKGTRSDFLEAETVRPNARMFDTHSVNLDGIKRIGLFATESHGLIRCYVKRGKVYGTVYVDGSISPYVFRIVRIRHMEKTYERKEELSEFSKRYKN